MLAPSVTGRTSDQIAHLLPGTALEPWTLATAAVLDGDPRCRGHVLDWAGEHPSAGVFECDACTLELVPERDQLVAVLAGSLIVQTDFGGTLSLGAGDVAWLPSGLVCVVTVASHCRCAFHVRADAEEDPRSDD